MKISVRLANENAIFSKISSFVKFFIVLRSGQKQNSNTNESILRLSGNYLPPRRGGSSRPSTNRWRLSMKIQVLCSIKFCKQWKAKHFCGINIWDNQISATCPSLEKNFMVRSYASYSTKHFLVSIWQTTLSACLQRTTDQSIVLAMCAHISFLMCD